MNITKKELKKIVELERELLDIIQDILMYNNIGCEIDDNNVIILDFKDSAISDIVNTMCIIDTHNASINKITDEKIGIWI